MRMAQRPLLKQIQDVVKDEAVTRVRASLHLQYVYDFASTDTPFADLKYIKDAGHSPLQDISEAQFAEKFGLVRTLSFTKAEPRPRVAHDWRSVYH